MTCNQIIVLMDIYRGFNSNIHHGTLDTDIAYLHKENLITEDNSAGFNTGMWKLTYKGQKFCEEIKQIDSSESPPLGLRPQSIFSHSLKKIYINRRDEIEQAIDRYKNANKSIPEEWTLELKEITKIISVLALGEYL
jgi:hypothetical protein